MRTKSDRMHDMTQANQTPPADEGPIEPTVRPVCSQCGFPLDEYLTGLRYFGTHTAHVGWYCTQRMRAQIEQLTTALKAANDQAERLERAWLVEWKAHGHGPQWWGFNWTPSKDANWCADPNKAIRFSRRADAERMRLHIIAVAGLTGLHGYERSISATEHEWPNVGAKRSAEGGPLERPVVRPVDKRED